MSTKVLVFESDAAFAAELRSELSKLGCSTSVVDDGNAGLQHAASDKPDLILLSIELPRMNGFSVCNKLKKDTKLKDVPLIIMSTESSDETFEQHRKLRTRAEDYVHKPIAFGELLQHINQFIQLEAPAAPAPTNGEGDGIVIDDEIASIDIEEEGTLVLDHSGGAAPQPPPAPPKRGSVAPKRAQSEAPKRASAVDDDIDAFIEGGFGKLTAPANGAAPVAEAKGPSVAPPAAEAPPTPLVDDGRVAALEKELQTAREEAAQLRADFDARMEAEQKKMDAEMDELRGKLATAGKGGVSSREFLDLREALNKKDKEILALKEQLGKKDKEIVDVREKALAFERTKADLDDKMIAALRELEEQKEKLDALGRDKDQAKKASEDFKTRLAKVQAELETRITDLNETKAQKTALQADLDKRAQELEDARVKIAEDTEAHAATLAKERAEHEATLAITRAEHEGALARERAEHEAALAKERAERAAELAAREQRAVEELAEAIAVREQELKAESDSRLGALHRAHQDEVGRVRAEHAQEKEALAASHESAVAQAQARHEAQMEELREASSAQLASREAELEAKRAAELESADRRRREEITAVERDRDERLAAAHREREAAVAEISEDRDAKVAAAMQDRDAKVAATVQERDGAVAAANRERDERVAAANRARDEAIGSLRDDLDRLTEQKQADDSRNTARIAELEQRGQELSQVREQLERDLATAKDRIVVLEAETAALRTELAEAKASHTREMQRAEKAYAKWEADRAALERAKDALAVVLSQIEDAEGRSIT